jgi:hypothetical protein
LRVCFHDDGQPAKAGVRDAEGSSLLEAVAKERLVMTQKAEKCLASFVVICELWSLAIKL